MEPLKLGVPLPDVLHESGGEIRVKGSRITLYQIVTAYNEQWVGPHAMVFYYPTLSLYQIEKVLEFYHANQTAVDKHVRAYRAVIDRQRAEGKQLDVAELRRRYEAKRAAGPPAGANGVHAPDGRAADARPTGG